MKKPSLSIWEYLAIKELLLRVRRELNVGPGDFVWLVGTAYATDKLVNIDNIIAKLPGGVQL
jgi:hypothetical protein